MMRVYALSGEVCMRTHRVERYGVRAMGEKVFMRTFHVCTCILICICICMLMCICMCICMCMLAGALGWQLQVGAREVQQ